jgi:hypothetical protein
MHPADQSETSPPAERRRALSVILAAGLLRLEPPPDFGAPSPHGSSQNLPEIQRDSLEVPVETRLSVPNG